MSELELLDSPIELLELEELAIELDELLELESTELLDDKLLDEELNSKAKS